MAKEYLMIDGKLVLVNNQLVQLPNESAYSDALENETISLASTEQLTNDIVSKLAGYVNGSPKRVFDNLTTLRNTYPNGIIGTYLCKDNLHFYIWNGSEWEDCGKYLTSNTDVTLSNGTIISNNADFAEVGKGNIPVGYFVTVNSYDTTNNVPIVIKATSTSDIRGVTVENPAFCGGVKSSMLSNGVLSSAYCYVGFAGVVNVIDNGKCTVNGVLAKRCMSADDGTATPSSNNMGYQIISRVNSTTIKIIVEPSADMIQRIKNDITDIMYRTGLDDEFIWRDDNDCINYYRSDPCSDNELVVKSYVDDKINDVKSEVKSYVDDKINDVKSEVKSYVDDKINDVKSEVKSEVKSYVDDNFATEHEAHSLRKELLDLKEEIYGTILDVTTIDVADNGVIPSVVNVEGTDYNVLPKGDVSVVNVYGDTTRCVNLFTLNNRVTITQGNEQWIEWSNQQLKDMGLVVGETYTFKAFDVPSTIFFQHLPSYTSNNNSFVFDDTTAFRLGANVLEKDTTYDTKIMIVKGTTPPTEFQPYFEGLKPTEYKSLNIIRNFTSGEMPTLFNSDLNIISTKKSGTVIDAYGLRVDFERDNHTFVFNGTFEYPNESVSTAGINVVSLGGDGGKYVFYEENNDSFDTVQDPNAEGGSTGGFDRYIVTCDAEGNRHLEDMPKVNLNAGYQEFELAPLPDGYYYEFVLYIENGTTFNNLRLKECLIKNPVSTLVQTPIELNGVNNVRDTLEVRLNPTTELYDVYKITKTMTFIWTRQTRYAMVSMGNYNIVIVNNQSSSKKQIRGISNRVGVQQLSVWMVNQKFKMNIGYQKDGVYRYDLNVGQMTLGEFNVWLEQEPLVITHELFESQEELITSNLDFEQVTALAHTNSSIKIVNPNDIYLNKPSAKLGIVYKKLNGGV